MKQCSTCKIDKELTEYTKNAAKKDGLHHSCKQCKKLSQAKWYKDHKEAHVSRVAKNRLEAILQIRDKKDVPCQDCGIKYPYYVMDFDHISDKTFSVAAGVRLYGIKKILEEIKKCEVVCTNCHRQRTHSRTSSSTAEQLPLKE